MKTAGSIPDDSFERTERLAPQQGRSRSEVDANAPDEHIAHHAGDQVTAAMNQACSKVEENNDAFLTAAGRRVLDNTDLRAISPPSSLDHAQFNNWLVAMISQTPLIAWIVSEIHHAGSVSETELERKLSELDIDTEEHRARDILETVRRWMTHFLAVRYETTADSLKLIRAKTL